MTDAIEAYKQGYKSYPNEECPYLTADNAAFNAARVAWWDGFFDALNDARLGHVWKAYDADTMRKDRLGYDEKNV